MKKWTDEKMDIQREIQTEEQMDGCTDRCIDRLMNIHWDRIRKSTEGQTDIFTYEQMDR